MTSGSIYIDPDGVSSVSSQMLKTADEIDALRQRIVPQVYNAVEMSYPSLNVLPQVGPSVGSAHENIGYFAYEAETVAHELRTSAYVLNQVANEGRLMMEQLLQQAMIFTAPGQSRSTGLLQQLLQDIQVPAGYLGAILGLLGNLSDYMKEIKNLKGLGNLLGSFKGQAWLFGLGYGLDVLSGSYKNPSDLANGLVSKLIGNGIGTAVGLTPWGRGAEIVAGAIQLGGGILSWEQYQIANEYTGTTRTQLQDPAAGLKTASNNANIGQFFDDVGSFVVDTGGAGTQLAPAFMVANGVAGMFGVQISQPGNVPTDKTNMLTDGGKLLLSPVQFVANDMSMQVDDGAASLNRFAQNLPLPSDVKGNISSMTNGTINVMNGVADFVTKPDDIKHLWNWATSG